MALAVLGRPLPEQPLPAPLCASDGLAEAAAPEDRFTWDTVTKRMPTILDAVLESLPAQLASQEKLLAGVRALQREMHTGAALQQLEETGRWVAATAWNEDLAGSISRGEDWHTAPWWLVENYMYKRLLQELARCGAEAACYDPFQPQKQKALVQAASALEPSLRPLLELIAEAEAAPEGDEQRCGALEAALLRSLWGNQADLSLSGGQVASTSGGVPGQLISDGRATALELLQRSAGQPTVLVLDNHGLEVLCDLVLVDAVLRLVNPSFVALHVKDAPVFVSDVTEADVPGILDWLNEHEPALALWPLLLRPPPPAAPGAQALAGRLRSALEEGRLRVVPSCFYTTAKAFWELPADLCSDYSEAAVVILKGDANYRRLLGDLHWPYDTDFGSYAQSFWPSPGLICLRTMKSGVALGISPKEQARAKAVNPEDWLTSGVYGQVLASSKTA